MHIHFHDSLDHEKLPVQPAEWDAAAKRAGKLGEGHVVTFSTDFDSVRDEVEVIIAPPYRLQQINMHSAPKLKLIQSTYAGMDSLYPFDIIPRTAMLLNNRGVHGKRAGEYCAMAILMLTNKMPLFATQQRQKHWQRAIGSLANRQRITIVGLGAIGTGAAHWARQLGMHITGIRHGNTPHPDCDATFSMDKLDEVLPTTDILLLACPLTPLTTNLLSRERIALLPSGAGVINVGRGKLVEQEALCDALDAGRLGGAVLDVFAVEPIPPTDRIWTTINMVITPHMSADDPLAYNADTLDIFFENLAAYLAGKTPPTLVDLTKGY
ncbi:MAG: hydroxyacid dehydrogenase [Acidocella sp. 20-57-95]|nr:MAG: hydroxyacid dehydrogenase [Acidocella sp. 20-57-95]OYV62285.1 MAG: hydroxyacid dehydrogenase [Acidocella sp. 21-58-7]HQT63340.1 D-2-hydroxyacid dehydrogenase [Acidocella sp.]HQU03943.1 D-2-hydroxyacid dehydrogenase [Acidocella sp.]